MITNLQQLYFDQLRDLYSAESQLVAAIPELARHATDQALRKAFNIQAGQTRTQRARLQDVFSQHGLNPGGEECQAMRGLIREAKKHLHATAAGNVRDAVLIASANRIGHYQIAAYGVARSLAECLGLDDDAHTLLQSLTEESEADDIFTGIATGSLFRSGVNEAALH